MLTLTHLIEGGRQLDAQQRLKRFVERENKMRIREAEANFTNSSISDSSIEYSIAAFNTLQEITKIYHNGKKELQINVNKYVVNVVNCRGLFVFG